MSASSPRYCEDDGVIKSRILATPCAATRGVTAADSLAVRFGSDRDRGFVLSYPALARAINPSSRFMPSIISYSASICDLTSYRGRSSPAGFAYSRTNGVVKPRWSWTFPPTERLK